MNYKNNESSIKQIAAWGLMKAALDKSVKDSCIKSGLVRISEVDPECNLNTFLRSTRHKLDQLNDFLTTVRDNEKFQPETRSTALAAQKMIRESKAKVDLFADTLDHLATPNTSTAANRQVLELVERYPESNKHAPLALKKLADELEKAASIMETLLAKTGVDEAAKDYYNRRPDSKNEVIESIQSAHDKLAEHKGNNAICESLAELLNDPEKLKIASVSILRRKAEISAEDLLKSRDILLAAANGLKYYTAAIHHVLTIRESSATLGKSPGRSLG